MIKKSFTLRVLVISFLLLALPLLVDSFIFFQDSYYDAIGEAKSELKAEANFRTFTVMSIEPVREVLLRELIYILDLENTLDNPDFNKMNRVLREAVHEGGSFELFILRIESESTYKIISSSDVSFVGTSFVSYRQLGPILEKGEGSFIRYSYSEITQQYIPFIYLIHVIKSEKTGEPIGAVMVVSNVEHQLNALIAKTSSLHSVEFAMLSADGIVFASSDPKLHGNYFEPISKERREEIISTGQIGISQLSHEPLPVIKTRDPPFFEFIFNDQVQIAYRSFLQVGGISVMSYSAKEEFFGSAVRHFLLIYTMYGLILVVGGGVTYWLSLLISRPLRQLADKMGEVSQGNLGVRFQEEPLGFEINILGSIFNSTIDNLLENIQRAEDERVKKETYQRELSISRSVQRSLLPHQIPQLKGVEAAGIYLPAKDVGGDFYGCFKKTTQMGEEVLMLTVADAPGKGIFSCLYSFSLRSLIRTYTTLYDDLGIILSLSNNAFIQDAADTGIFMTLFHGMFQPKSKMLTYYSCGHVPGLVKRADGALETLVASGIAIGLKESGPYSADTIQLYSGDMVIVYTDGLMEIVNESQESFSKGRIRDLVQNGEWKSAQEFVSSMTEEVDRFTQSKAQEEEIVIVAFKVE